MKDNTGIIMISMLVVFAGNMIMLLVVGTDLRDRLKTIKPEYPITIDIPEEYKAISNNPDNRTNLSGYIKNDTLFIEFKH